MLIYPAIDLLDGNCVRLHGGDYDSSTVYSTSPVETALAFESAGAEWLHLIDLEGARNPACRQKDLISLLMEKSGLHIQTGGGIRNAADVDELIKMGAHRVIIGSMSVKNPKATKTLLEKHGPDRIVLALDVKGDPMHGYYVATYGWKSTSTSKLEDVLSSYNGIAKHVLCTDISKDGKLSGPNVGLYKFLSRDYPGFVFQASGGVSNLDDLRQLKNSGAGGAIIGKALYEGKFTIPSALEAVA